uniref:Transcription initiation factor TFIID subunit 8 n=2 Tax=Arion vulgaris TaxID=1028688 RepID=A0A0B6ZLX0_9EUPU
MTAEPTSGHASSPWRRALKTSVAALLVEIGYQAAETLALETFIEMAEAYIYEAGRGSRAYAELAGRTLVMPSDVVMALVEMGLDFTAIPDHARRENKTVFLPPIQTPLTGPSKILQVGEKRKHPAHIPDYLPPFPDPHTHIRTACFKQPTNEYQLVREKAASQKRNVEVALTRFIAKTGTTQSLFKDDKSAFPLIACKPSPLPYMSALLPSDCEALSQDNSEADTKSSHHQVTSDRGPLGDSLHEDTPADSEPIDNPYLLPAKIVKKTWT